MDATDIGRELRAIRNSRGWARETLAHHAGVSWAAITQIEAGRRTDPRLSTVIALAEALEVSVDQLIGRVRPASGAPAPLKHRVLFYADDVEFVDGTVPFITAGLERSEAVLAVTERSRIGRLRRALGGDARRVQFRDSSKWYSSPQGAMHNYRTFLEKRVHGGSQRVRIVGEPAWANRSAQEIRAWTRYEAMINVSLATWPATIVCPYGTRALPAHIVAEARCTHPEVMTGSSSSASPEYQQPEALLLAGP